jgi:hypothetical protein
MIMLLLWRNAGRFGGPPAVRRSGSTTLPGSARPIHLGAAADLQDVEALGVVVEAVDDAEVAATRCPQTFEFPLQRLTAAARIRSQATEDEGDKRLRDSRWDGLQTPQSAAG